MQFASLIFTVLQMQLKRNTNAPKGRLGPYLVPEFSFWDYLVDKGHYTNLRTKLRLI